MDAAALRALRNLFGGIQTFDRSTLKMDFGVEFVALLKKHDVPFDPKFVLGEGMKRVRFEGGAK